MSNEIKRPTVYTRRSSINWERVFFLLVFPTLCWTAFLLGIGAALFAD